MWFKTQDLHTNQNHNQSNINLIWSSKGLSKLLGMKIWGEMWSDDDGNDRGVDISDEDGGVGVGVGVGGVDVDGDGKRGGKYFTDLSLHGSKSQYS